MTGETKHHAPRFETSIFARITGAAMRHSAINLGQGFPSFDGPEHIRRAAAAAIMSGRNQYAPLAGEPTLRTAVASWMDRTQGVDVDPDTEVTVVAGATAGLLDTLLGLVHPGDEVVVVEPSYDAYAPAIEMAGGVPRFVAPDIPAYRIDESLLETVATAKTRALLINSPNNPTGRVYDAQEWNAIEAFCTRHDLVLICDEVYERLVFDPARHRCPLGRPGLRHRTVAISSIGKTFSLTGWKIGWVLACPALTARIRAAHQFTIYSVATPLQIGAAAALERSAESSEDFQTSYQRRRDMLYEGLDRLGLHPISPEGTFFMLTDVGRLGVENDAEFCDRLIREVGVAAIPSSPFHHDGRSGPVRFAFCHDDARLQAAIERLQNVDRILP